MGVRGNVNKKLGICIKIKIIIIMWVQIIIVNMVAGNNALFRVEHKFKGGKRSLKELLAHDARRHNNGRILDSIDLPLGGNGQPSDTGLYYTKIMMGNPAEEYHVQVDTGSDIMWVNCAGCATCPTKSRLITLNQYDPKTSSTANVVKCDDIECSIIFQGPRSGCQNGSLCEYGVTYGDGSANAGYFVQDTLHYDKVIANLQTSTGDGAIVFGCGNKQTGQLTSSDEAVDGIIGFGQSSSSVISQLAATGKVKKMFSHCLDNINGGGIFAIGQVVDPKFNTTPIIPHQPHYNVVLKSIEVGGQVVNSSSSSSSSDVQGAVVDSGTTLAYLPAEIYKPVIDKILSQQPGLQMRTVEEQFQCFKYAANIDDGFPKVLFNFENDLILTIYPHDYLFPLSDDDNEWCIGWLNSGFQSKDGKQVTILGDIIFSNKLVVYDLENQNIGWIDYNCSSTIKVADAPSAVHEVSSHEINSATSSLILGTSLVVSLLIILVNLSLSIHN